MADDDEGLTPEDLEALGKPAQIAPEDVPAETPAAPAAPGSADEFIDQTNAQPLAAPVSGTVPDDNAFPPPVPAEAPGMVPPKGPAPAPGATPTTPAPAAPLTAEGNIRAEGDLAAKGASINEETAQKLADEADRHREQVEQDRVDALADRQAAIDRVNEKVAEYEKSKELRDPRSAWTTSDKVRNKVAVLFGALGAGMSAAGGTPTGNVVLQDINRRLEAETERQKYNIARASDSVVMAQTGLRDADAARRELEQNEDTRHAARLGSAIAEGKAQLASQGIPAAQQETDARVIDLRRLQTAAVQKAHDDAVKNANIEARTRLFDRKAAGIGGVSSKARAAAEKEAFKEAEGKKNDDIKERRLLKTEVGQFAKENELPKLTETHNSLQEIRDKLSGDNPDPVSAMTSLMELDRASKGGTATGASMQAIMSHLGGAKEKILGLIEKGETGNLAPEQIKILRTAVDAADAGNKKTIDRVHEAFKDQFYNDPTRQDLHEAVASHAAGIFGPLGYASSRSAKPAAPAAEDPKISLAREALKDPGAPDKVKIRAAQVLRAAGVK